MRWKIIELIKKVKGDIKNNLIMNNISQFNLFIFLVKILKFYFSLTVGTSLFYFISPSYTYPLKIRILIQLFSNINSNN